MFNHSLIFPFPDQAGWISDLAARDCQSWNGVLLSQPLNIEKRQLIKKNVASLLDFRDYLFSRQCTSLFLQFKPWEVAKRSIPFMHNCIKEIQMLGVGCHSVETSSTKIIGKVIDLIFKKIFFRSRCLMVPWIVGSSWVVWKYSRLVRNLLILVTWILTLCTLPVCGTMPESKWVHYVASRLH